MSDVLAAARTVPGVMTGTGAGTRLFAARDGRTLSYRRTGSGPAVVVLADEPALDPAACLGPAPLVGHQQVLFAARGAGWSDPPADPSAYSLADHVADLEDLQDHLGGEPLTLLGSGHGVSVALGLARTRPGAVEAMVLAGGPVRVDQDYEVQLRAARRRFAGAAPHGERRLEAADAAEEDLDLATDDPSRHAAYALSLQAHVAVPTPASSDFLARMAASRVRFAATAVAYDELVAGLDLLAGSGWLQVPTLVLAGGLDATVPAEHLRLLAGTLPCSTFRVFPDAGHFLALEAPGEWSRTVGAFLDAGSGRHGR